MKLPLLKEAKVYGKTVFLRADLDVPLAKFEIRNPKFEMGIGDETRLLAWMPTLKFLIDDGAKVIVAGHLGRPGKKYQISNIKFQISNEDRKYSLEPVAEWLSKKLNIKYQKSKIGNFEGWKIGNQIFLLENLRFYEGEENPSTSSGLEFSKSLASLADIYVNDAFAASHRDHASIVGVPKFLPHYAGLRLQKEVEVLSGILEHPKRPLVVLIGGAKIETKLPLVEKMYYLADRVLVGGKIAGETQALLKVQREKLKSRGPALLIADLNQEGTDITPKSMENFLRIISLAKTVVWNGPVGLISSKFKVQSSKLTKDTERGTIALAEGIVKSKAYTIVGGGDTIGFLNKVRLIDKFSFVSTGGGAMLSFLSGEKLPGLVALTKT